MNQLPIQTIINTHVYESNGKLTYEMLNSEVNELSMVLETNITPIYRAKINVLIKQLKKNLELIKPTN